MSRADDASVDSTGHERTLLVSDVDNTLLGDDEALCEFAHWVEPRRDHLQLVYASGRFADSVRESVETTLLPEPDAVIGGVGTEIRLWSTWDVDPDWEDRLLQGWDAEQVRTMLGELPHTEFPAELQPQKFLSPFKVSYYWHDAAGADIARLETLLRDEGGLNAKVIYSSNRDLDVLPEGADKGLAAAHLVRQWSYSDEDVIVAGDSGNDLALFRPGFRGVIVANAHGELKELTGDRIYHSSQAFAAGVLDGLRHWAARRAMRS